MKTQVNVPDDRWGGGPGGVAEEVLASCKVESHKSNRVKRLGRVVNVADAQGSLQSWVRNY